jgi:glycosyltransferase involved in cell wall biosynthesis
VFSARPTWIVVPAFNEADHVAGSIQALGVAAAKVEGPVHVLLVDDGSTDDTAARALAAPRGALASLELLRGRAEGVGWARRVGFERALELAGMVALHTPQAPEALIATTDADSRVDPHWLAVLHRRLDAGHGVIAGDVLLESETDPRLVLARAARLRARLSLLPTPERDAEHPHFAGSNLAFAADQLRELGPLPTPVALEDEAILERCRALGIPFVRCSESIVVTSSRTQGRAPKGLAVTLALDALELV